MFKEFKGWGTKGVLLLVALVMVVAGCSNSEPPKEAVQSSFAKVAEMKSYTFTSVISFDELQLPESLMTDGGAEAAMLLGMLKDATLTMDGTYAADPMRMEMDLTLALAGDMAFTLSMPIIMQDTKLWIRIPSIPLLPMEGLSGQFIELDLAQMGAKDAFPTDALDVQKQTQLAQELLGIVVKHFDEEAYFAEIEAAEAGEAFAAHAPDQVIRMLVDDSSLEQTVDTITGLVLPEMLNLLADNAAYRELLQLSEEQLQGYQAKVAGLPNDQGWQEARAELLSTLLLEEMSLTTAIKDGFPVYQQFKLLGDLVQDGETARIGMSVSAAYANINEDVAFRLDIPTNAIPMEELGTLF